MARFVCLLGHERANTIHILNLMRSFTSKICVNVHVLFYPFSETTVPRSVAVKDLVTDPMLNSVLCTSTLLRDDRFSFQNSYATISSPKNKKQKTNVHWKCSYNMYNAPYRQ